MELHSANSAIATPLSAAYSFDPGVRSTWLRPELAPWHNRLQSQFEIYRHGELAGFVRYSMNGSEVWLLYTQLTTASDARCTDALFSDILDESAQRHLAVHPYCTRIRGFIREHPDYLALVPRSERKRFGLETEPVPDRAVPDKPVPPLVGGRPPTAARSPAGT